MILLLGMAGPRQAPFGIFPAPAGDIPPRPEGGTTSTPRADRVGSAAPTTSELDAEGDDLADRVHASPFLRPGWFAAWSSAFGGPPIELLTVRRGGRLTGVPPLVRTGPSFRSPTNWHTPEFSPVAEDRADVLALARRGPRTLAPARPRGLPGLGSLGDRGVERRRRRLSTPLHPARSRTPAVREGRRPMGRVRAHPQPQAGDGRPAAVAEPQGRGSSAIASRRDTDGFYRDLARWAAGRGNASAAVPERRRAHHRVPVRARGTTGSSTS